MLKRNQLALVLATLSLMSVQAHAALSTEAAAAFTALEASGEDYIAAAWSVAIVIVVGFVGIKLFKKAVGKAT